MGDIKGGNRGIAGYFLCIYTFLPYCSFASSFFLLLDDLHHFFNQRLEFGLRNPPVSVYVQLLEYLVDVVIARVLHMETVRQPSKQHSQFMQLNIT